MFSDYSNPKMPRYTNVDVSAACAAIGLTDENVLIAVIKIESNGRGFQSNGKLKMLFEPHIFYANLKTDAEKLAAAVGAGVAYQHWGERPYPADSYARLLTAMAIDETAALESASWGMAQILGGNFKAAGFGSPQLMVSAMTIGEGAQVEAMANFLKSAGLSQAMNDKDWVKIARGYNGPGYAVNHYDTRLASTYAALPPFATDALPANAPISYAKPDVVEVPGEVLSTTGDAPSTPEHLPPAPITDTGVILSVQKQLQALGYAGVGTPDGNASDWTEAAILDFRNQHNKAFPNLVPQLPLVPTIDSDLLIALAQGPAKPISEARATATVSSSIVADLPATIAAGKNKVVAWVVGIPAAIGSLIQGILDTVPDAKGKLEPLHDLAGSIPAWAWAAAVAAVAGIVWLNAHSTQEAQAAAVRTGKTV